MFKSLFSYEGRIRRLEYGITILVGVLFISFISAILTNDRSLQNSIVFNILNLVFMATIGWSQGAKRCHDIGNSGWYQLIPFYIIILIFKDGDYYENEYGPNPKGINSNVNTLNKNNSNINSTSNQNANIPNSSIFGYNGGHNTSKSTLDNGKNLGKEYKKGNLYN